MKNIVAARRRLIPRARPSEILSVKRVVVVLFVFPPDWLIGVVLPVDVSWEMELLRLMNSRLGRAQE